MVPWASDSWILLQKQFCLFSFVLERCREANILGHSAYRNPPPRQLSGSHWELGEVTGRARLCAVQYCWPAFHHCPPGPNHPPAEHLGHDCCPSRLWHQPREEHPFPAISGQLLRLELRKLLFSDYLRKKFNGLYSSCLWFFFFFWPFKGDFIKCNCFIFIFPCIHIIEYYYNAIIFSAISWTVLGKFIMLHIPKNFILLLLLTQELFFYIGLHSNWWIHAVD